MPDLCNEIKTIIMKRFITAILCTVIMATSCAQQDQIVGVWEVDNQYYKATYEIVEHEGKFFGKVHYFNDGDSEYTGNNKKEDYFLTDVERKGDAYEKGKMYMPDGSFYNVIFKFRGPDELEVSMTVEGQPYKETWKRGKGN